MHPGVFATHPLFPLPLRKGRFHATSQLPKPFSHCLRVRQPETHRPPSGPLSLKVQYVIMGVVVTKLVCPHNLSTFPSDSLVEKLMLRKRSDLCLCGRPSIKAFEESSNGRTDFPLAHSLQRTALLAAAAVVWRAVSWRIMSVSWPKESSETTLRAAIAGRTVKSGDGLRILQTTAGRHNVMHSRAEIPSLRRNMSTSGANFSSDGRHSSFRPRWILSN